VRSVPDGRIYTARQAKQAGLVDEIGTFDEAFQAMQDEYGLEDCDLLELQYDSDSLLMTLFGEAGLARVSEMLEYGKGDIGAALEFVEKNSRSPVRYMFR
jgi:ClpP class serine protease